MSFVLIRGLENSLGQFELKDNIRVYLEIISLYCLDSKKTRKVSGVSRSLHESQQTGTQGGAASRCLAPPFPFSHTSISPALTFFFSLFLFPAVYASLSLASDSCLAPVMTELKRQHALIQWQDFNNASWEVRVEAWKYLNLCSLDTAPVKRLCRDSIKRHSILKNIIKGSRNIAVHNVFTNTLKYSQQF